MEEIRTLMEKEGVEMNVVSYNMLMKGWSQAGHRDKVKELFNQMMCSSGHTCPDVRSWNIYVEALGKAGELSAMEQAVSKMEQRCVLLWRLFLFICSTGMKQDILIMASLHSLNSHGNHHTKAIQLY